MRQATQSVAPHNDAAAIKSAKRVLEVFEFFAQRRAPATIGEISAELGYPQSSTSVLMRCLLDMRYMQYDAERRAYRPTLRLALTSSWLGQQDLSGEELTRLMVALRDKTGCSVVLGVQSEVDLQYIQVIPTKMPVQLVMRIGQRRPLCRTAAGKVLLAQHNNEAITALVRRINARGEDSERIDIKLLLAEVAEIRKTGLAYSANAASPGAAVIAALVPLSDRDLPMAVGVGGPIELVSSNRATIGRQLLAALNLG